MLDPEKALILAKNTDVYLQTSMTLTEGYKILDQSILNTEALEFIKATDALSNHIDEAMNAHITGAMETTTLLMKSFIATQDMIVSWTTIEQEPSPLEKYLIECTNVVLPQFLVMVLGSDDNDKEV